MNAQRSMVTLAIFSCWICSIGCCLMICLSCGGILSNSAANLTPCTFDRVSKAHHTSSHSQVWLSGVRLFVTINENRLFSAYKLSKLFQMDESIHSSIQPSSLSVWCLLHFVNLICLYDLVSYQLFINTNQFCSRVWCFSVTRWLTNTADWSNPIFLRDWVQTTLMGFWRL